MSKNIADRIRHVRKSHELSQAEFAQALCIGQSTLSMMESGQRTVKEHHIRVICEKFDINPEWLHTGRGAMERLPSLQMRALIMSLIQDEQGAELMEKIICLTPEERKHLNDEFFEKKAYLNPAK